MKKAVIALAALLLLGPFIALVGIGVLMNPAANAACTIDGSGITVGNIPDDDPFSQFAFSLAVHAAVHGLAPATGTGWISHTPLSVAQGDFVHSEKYERAGEQHVVAPEHALVFHKPGAFFRRKAAGLFPIKFVGGAK